MSRQLEERLKRKIDQRLLGTIVKNRWGFVAIAFFDLGVTELIFTIVNRMWIWLPLCHIVATFASILGCFFIRGGGCGVGYIIYRYISFLSSGI